MLSDLKHDQIVDKFGGRFKLSSVVQKRWRELMHGARPMVEPEGMTDLEVVLKEVMEGKIDVDGSPVETSAEKAE